MDPAHDDGATPAPPPKIVSPDSEGSYTRPGILKPPPIQVTSQTGNTLSPSSPLSSRVHTPRTPTTPMSTSPSQPSSPSAATASASSSSKKANPLVDLNETEKVYVDQLTGIIRKVAGAWSRSNLPPPHLDTMFRSIESVYKANRSLHNKLKEIGTNPSSPKALGDLLMRWIDDLDAPYTLYCTNYRTGFNEWEPVRDNVKLPGILSTFSQNVPPPSSSSGDVWTLDELFRLPAARVKYYRKLYSRLLKSTAPGRSDYKLLSVACEKLDKLIGLLESRERYRAGAEDPDEDEQDDTPLSSSRSKSNRNDDNTQDAPPELGEDEVVVDMRTKRESENVLPPLPSPGGMTAASSPMSGSQTYSPVLPPIPPSSGSLMASVSMNGAESEPGSARASGSSNGIRSSNDTAATSLSRSSSTTMSMPVAHLEKRCSTARVLDIFTMKPKVVRLQITPPQLIYTRELRFSADVVISVTPRATQTEVVHHRGHIFLLSDLFLVCERMTEEERAMEMRDSGEKDVDMWLCYPPLAGKVLRVSEVEGRDNVFQVAIMRKENLFITVESVHARDYMMREFKECIDFAASVGPVSKQAPPPMPPLPPSLSGNNMGPPGHQRPPRVPTPEHMRDRESLIPPASASSSRHASMSPPTSPPGSRAPSVQGGYNGFPGPGMMDQQRRFSPTSPPPRSPGQDGMMPFGMNGPNDPSAFAGSVVPPARGASAGGPVSPGMVMQRNPSIGPGQIMSPPPQRAPSVGPGQVMPQRAPSVGPPGGMPPMQRNPSFGAPGGPGGPPPGAYGRGPPPPHQGGPPPHPGYGGPNGMHPSQSAPAYPPHGMPPNQNGFPPGPGGPGMGMGMGGGGRPPSDPSFQGGVRKTPSSRSLGSQYDSYQSPPHQQNMPPLPPLPNAGGPGGYGGPPSSSNSYASSLHAPQPRTMLPSAQLSARAASGVPPSFDDPSPPNSPVEESQPLPSGPVTSTVAAQMKCKVFLKQQHAQWKSLGSAKLKLYRQEPTNVKQLVVEADSSGSKVLISTIVLTDGVERVGKTGVAIELSDKGQRTGIVYMIQLRNEKSAGGLFDELLSGSDRGR